MKGARVRFFVVAGLFVLWLGYLAYLVAVTPREPVLLCRPQFLIADVVVLAHVDAVDKPIRVEEVFWAPAGDESKLAGATLPVSNLAACAPPRHLRKTSDQKDFAGPGTYILPLRESKLGETGYAVAATPPAPGYPAAGPPEPGPPRLYSATPEARFQLGQIKENLQK
jgi:hypothetical protein